MLQENNKHDYNYYNNNNSNNIRLFFNRYWQVAILETSSATLG